MGELNAAQEFGGNPFNYEGDPSLFLGTTNYLDPDDLIDRLLIGLKEDVRGLDDGLLTEAEQLRLVFGVRNDDLTSAHELVEGNKGVIAAVAYPFKFGGVDAEELLKEGARSMIRAAKTHRSEEHPIFSDYAVTVVHGAFRERWPEHGIDSFVEAQDRPMERVYSFAETLDVADTPLKRAKKEQADRDHSYNKLDRDEIDVLRLLNLQNKDIAMELGLSTTTISHRLNAIKDKLGVETREAVAIEALNKGAHFDLPDIPGREVFSIRERQIAMRLAQTNESISEELGLTKRQFDRTMAGLYKKTKARTRAELTILAHVNDFEPTEEELNPPERSFADTLSPLQKEVFQRMIYQQDAEMAEELPVSLSAIQRIAQKAVDETGSYDRTQLILQLYRQGMEFDVIEPEKTVVEILNSHEIELVRSLHMPYERIAETFGYDDIDRIGNIIYRAKQKVGARSRHELALLVEMIGEDEGDALEVQAYKTNEWRLAKRLGLKTLEACDIDSLILEAQERQREVIIPYYLAKKAVQLSEVSDSLGISVSAASSRLMRGVAAMKRKLEAA